MNIKDRSIMTDINEILDKLEENCTVKVTELSEESKINFKMVFMRGTEIKEETTRRINDISKQSKEDIRDIMTREYGKLFKNIKPGYRCEILLPKLTRNSMCSGRKLTKRDLDRCKNSRISNICRLVIKECFNIENYETVYNNLCVTATPYSMDGDTAEFVSEQNRIGLFGCGSSFDANGYTMVLKAVIE